MKKIDRYIASHIFTLSAIVALGLVSIFTFINFVGDIDETGQGGFGVQQLITYSLLRMPSAIYVLLPIIAMLGTLMGLGTLAGQGELTAMRAAGISMMRIGLATLMAGAVLGVFCVILGDWLAPAGIARAEAYRSEARSGVPTGVTRKPVWLRDGEHIFHIQSLLAEDHIAEVEIFTFAPDLSLASSLRVKQGRYVDGVWQFQGISRTDFGELSAKGSQQDTMQWRGRLSPEVLRLFVLESDTLSTPGLARLIAYLDENRLDAAEYRFALWRKLVAPFTVMALMLFAVPFVLGPLRNTGAGQRLLVGVLIGVGFYVINEVTASLGQLYTWPAALAAGLPTAALIAFGLVRLSKAR